MHKDCLSLLLWLTEILAVGCGCFVSPGRGLSFTECLVNWASKLETDKGNVMMQMGQNILVLMVCNY